MSRSSLIALAALLVGAGIFILAFRTASRLSAGHFAQTTDDLEWLRQEFHLGEADLQRIRQLHEGYLPRCQEMCALIAAKKRELDEALTGATNLTAVAEQKLAEVAALRAQCQTHMLRHFYEVSRAMPPAQGRRYLDEMRRLTLGLHEQIEQSMANPPAAHHERP